MAGVEKKALIGFDRFRLFPILANDFSYYSVGQGFYLNEAQSLLLETNSTTETIYADDMVYLENTNIQGKNATMTLAEISLLLMAQMGFGIYDETTDTLEENWQGSGLSFASTYRALLASGKYRMFKKYCFMVTEVKETSGLNTKGSGNGIGTYQVTGMFTTRKFDNKPGQIHDGIDFEWLDTIESAGTAVSPTSISTASSRIVTGVSRRIITR